jgi:Cft2 family RNA processing exonuclease
MPQLTPVSGLGAKGPACFLVEADGARLLLDLGYGPQPGVWTDVSRVGCVDALLLSHSHPDHAGALKLLPEVGNPPVYASEIVGRMVSRAVETFSLPLQGVAEVCGIKVRTGRTGHAPGGVWLHLDIGGGLLYMGDCCSESLLYAYDPPPPTETLILDASYGAYDKSLRECLVEFDELFDRGPVLMPTASAGRGPEKALYLLRSGRALPHLDSVMRAALERLAGEASSCLATGVADDMERLIRECPPIAGASGVILAGSPDGDSGTAAELISKWEREAQPAIVFTGYLPPGTPAERLTKSGRAQYKRWNVHPRLSDNANLVRETGAKRVLPAFGDARYLPDWQAAFAPARVTLEGPVAL